MVEPGSNFSADIVLTLDLNKMQINYTYFLNLRLSAKTVQRIKDCLIGQL